MNHTLKTSEPFAFIYKDQKKCAWLSIFICIPSFDFLYKASPAISLGCSYIHGAHPVTAWPLSFRASSLSILFSTPTSNGSYSESCHHPESFRYRSSTDLSISQLSNWSFLLSTCFMDFSHCRYLQTSILAHCISPSLSSPLSLFSLDSMPIISIQPTIPKFFYFSFLAHIHVS